MRSLALLIAAIAAFGGYLQVAHDRARRLLDREEAALARIRALAREEPGDPVREAGYLFAWEQAEGRAPLLVGRPVRGGEDGVRWFATTDGNDVHEFDTVLHRVPGGTPDRRLLHIYLAIPGDRRPGHPPPGWSRTE